MEKTKIERAAEWLYEEALSAHTMVPFPAEMAPVDLSEAYAIQDAYVARLMAVGSDKIVGWKLAWTTTVMQEFVGVDHPCAGAILGRHTFASPAKSDADLFIHGAAEAELAVRIARDLCGNAGDYDQHDIPSAIAAVMPAIELLEDRNLNMAQSTPGLMIAANALNTGCVLGVETTQVDTAEIGALDGEMQINGHVVGKGRTSDVLGHPFAAVAWLANHLLDRGRMLREGDIVLTGSIIAPQWIIPGDQVTAAITGLGEARLTVG